jgi:hypothetical protein
MQRVFVLCLSLSFTFATALAQNWPSFRGANASGVVEGAKTPTTWNAEKSHNILWKTAIPAPHSTTEPRAQRAGELATDQHG